MLMIWTMMEITIVICASTGNDKVAWFENKLSQNEIVINGHIFQDANQNGVWNSSEIGLEGILIIAEGVGSTYSKSDGSYTLRVPSNQENFVIYRIG